AMLDNKPSVHLHASFAGRDHISFGGHLIDGFANNIEEIALLPFSSVFERVYSHTAKLNLLTFRKGNKK
ncbi:MAG: hypothetical protein QXP70_00885, partial [Methanomassiliicoccales archaeon]